MGLVKRDASGAVAILPPPNGIGGSGSGSGGGRWLPGRFAAILLLVCLYAGSTNVILMSSVDNVDVDVVSTDGGGGGSSSATTKTKSTKTKTKTKTTNGSQTDDNNVNDNDASSSGVAARDPSRRTGGVDDGDGNENGSEIRGKDEEVVVVVVVEKEKRRKKEQENRRNQQRPEPKPYDEPPVVVVASDGGVDEKKKDEPAPEPAAAAAARSDDDDDDDDATTYTCTYGPDRNNRTTVVVPKDAPRFVIIGVQKAGSTALLTHFRDHPMMLQTKLSYRREAHFFDKRWQTEVDQRFVQLGITSSNDKNCLALEQYMRLFETETILANSQTTPQHNHNHDNNATTTMTTTTTPIYTFEKTPSYFCHPKAAVRMKKTVPWTKLVLILRNPVDRLYSQYKMTVQNDYAMRKFSLEDLVHHEIRNMISYNMTTAPNLVPIRDDDTNATTTTDDEGPVRTADRYEIPSKVPNDHAVFDPRGWNPKHRSIIKADLRGPGKHVMVRRGLYGIQLRWWLDRYVLGKDLLVINHRDLLEDTRSVYEKVLDFADIPIPYDRRNSTKNNNDTDAVVGGIDFTKRIRADTNADDRPLSDETQRYLSSFYEPYNAELEELLGPSWSPSALGWD